MGETYARAVKEQSSQASYLSIKTKDDFLFCTQDDLKTNFLFEFSTNTRYLLQHSTSYKYWDYTHTFKPSASLSVENGNISSVQSLVPGLFEYEFVEKMFKDAFKDRPESHFGCGGI